MNSNIPNKSSLPPVPRKSGTDRVVPVHPPSVRRPGENSGGGARDDNLSWLAAILPIILAMFVGLVFFVFQAVSCIRSDSFTSKVSDLVAFGKTSGQQAGDRSADDPAGGGLSGSDQAVSEDELSGSSDESYDHVEQEVARETTDEVRVSEGNPVAEEIAEQPAVVEGNSEATDSTGSDTADLRSRSLTIAPPPNGNASLETGSDSMRARSASDYDARVTERGGQSGELQVTLAWDNYNDLDLHLICPSGEEIYFGKKFSACGGRLDVDTNAGGPDTNRAVENIVWTRGRVAKGSYLVRVNHFASNGSPDPTLFRVRIRIGDTSQEFNGRLHRNSTVEVKRFFITEDL